MGAPLKNTAGRFVDPVLVTPSIGIIHRLPMENFRKGATAPTEIIRGNIAGFLFDADAESIYVQFCTPTDWDQSSDLIMVIWCVLVADETASDKIDWETVVLSVADHEDVDVAPTQTPGAAHDIGAFVNAGTMHKVQITLDWDDGACPIALGDNITIVLSRTANVGAAGYVAGVIANDICILYQKDRLGT